MKPTAKPETPAPVADWLQQGTERFFAVQRILLDLAVSQNTIALNALRERMAVQPASASTLAELAGESVSNFVAAQQIVLSLAGRQNELFINGARDGFAEFASQTSSAFIAAHKQLLDTASKQMDLNQKAARRTMEILAPIPVNEMAALARRSIESFIDAQGALLATVAAK